MISNAYFALNVGLALCIICMLCIILVDKYRHRKMIAAYNAGYSMAKRSYPYWPMPPNYADFALLHEFQRGARAGYRRRELNFNTDLGALQ